jgi:hypothetical protein
VLTPRAGTASLAAVECFPWHCNVPGQITLTGPGTFPSFKKTSGRRRLDSLYFTGKTEHVAQNWPGTAGLTPLT